MLLRKSDRGDHVLNATIINEDILPILKSMLT